MSQVKKIRKKKYNKTLAQISNIIEGNNLTIAESMFVAASILGSNLHVMLNKQKNEGMDLPPCFGELYNSILFSSYTIVKLVGVDNDSDD